MGALSLLFSKLRGVPNGRILGRQTSGTGPAEALTAAELRVLASVPDIEQSLDQQFVGTITWTGTTAPSGTVTARYSWVRIGSLVWFNFRMSWTSSGASVTAAQWDMPAGMPQPATETGQDASEILNNMWGSTAAGQGAIGTSGVGTESRMQLSGTSSTQFKVRFGSATVGFLSASGVYRCV